MTLETSASIMDTIFASPEEDNRARLLKLLQEFLVSEVSKHALQEKGIFHIITVIPTSEPLPRIRQNEIDRLQSQYGGTRGQHPWICRIRVYTSAFDLCLPFKHE